MALGTAAVLADSLFVEAETFQVSGNGWFPSPPGKVKTASALRTLSGATGETGSTASSQIEVVTPGTYRVWVRYLETPAFRGPFTVRLRQNGRDVAVKTFDLEPRAGVKGGLCEWSAMDGAPLEAGFATLVLEKFDKKNCRGDGRQVDCFLLTDDPQLKPSHFAYGPQTWLRVTLGEIYDKPVYVEIFADHYRAPWYEHYSVSKAGLENGLRPGRADAYLRGGETTGWVNITPMIYQDSGAHLVVTVRERYQIICPRLKATFEFASGPSEKDVVKTFARDIAAAEEGQGVAFHVIVPPDLAKPENRDRLQTDSEIAEATGLIADRFAWPSFGKKPERFPFLVSLALEGSIKLDQKVFEREWKTLDYFGFNNRSKHVVGGGWKVKNGCYSQPDIERMKEHIARAAETFFKNGKKVEDIVFSMLTDEPTGQPLQHLADCASCTSAFRDWLREMSVSPTGCGVADWDAVKPVTDTNNPALYYYSQRFRTHALGTFMGLQRTALREAYGADIPAAPNFSDGATYVANAYLQGVDYFELLDSDTQNGLWSENWGNGSASKQCTTYNVELMRSAALKRGQTLGHHLIAYAGRRPWDIKLNAVSQAARDVKVFEDFYYGPSWGGHEGGPPWACSAWYAKTNTWYANAELTREFGAAEELLYPAKKVRSSVAILYSSSADIWTLGRNYAYGFDRMFTWLALTHDQVPVDFLSEKAVSEDALDAYRVCYLSGPNLTRAAAVKLAEWVRRGGVLVATAGAASRDEYNRPQTVLDGVLPAVRQPVEELQPFLGSGGVVDQLCPRDRVSAAGVDVLSVKQDLTPKAGSVILGAYSNGAPAYVSGRCKKGHVYQAGFLPGLAYMWPALVARRELEKTVGKVNAAEIPEASAVVSGEALLRRSQSPWQYPGAIRALIAKPVAASGVSLPVRCNVPLVDAVLMESEKGALVPLANYTLQPVAKLVLSVKTARRVKRVESVHAGPLEFRRRGWKRVEVSLPLQETDFVKLYY